MAELTGSGSIRDAQHALLWSATALVCFTATIVRQKLRVRWNPSIRRLFELTTTQSLRGGPLLNHWVLVEDRQRLQRACDELIAAGTELDLFYRVQLPSGITKHLRVAVRLLNADSKKVVGLLQDCTAPLSAERSLQISQIRWQSVGRLTLLDEIASGVAHELNQPLAAIATFAQAGERLLSMAEPQLNRAQQVFKEVSLQALRAGEVIRHMRSLIKRRAAQTETISTTELIKGFLVLAEPIAHAHHIELLTPENIPVQTVYVDATLIHQVLMILFQNAVDAVTALDAERQSVSLTVNLLPQGIEIAITDRGNGVSSTEAAQLFQPFFSTKENGTGLGLVSARNILETYGSRLMFDNLAEGGCRFWFVLPLAENCL